jgi:hypothetical protein
MALGYLAVQSRRSGQQFRTAIVNPRGHSMAIEFDFVQPLRPRRGLLDWLGKLRRHEAGKRDASARGASLTACPTDRLTTRGIAETQLGGTLAP